MRRVAVAALLVAACGRPALVTRPADAPRTLVLRNVRVFDAPRAALLDGPRDVLVQAGWIAAILPAGAAPPTGLEIHGGGGTLLPGLVDVHAHIQGTPAPPWHTELPDDDATLQAYLFAGVTTVLDTGALSPRIFATREAVHAGSTLGPHLYAAGPTFTCPDGHPIGFMRAAMPAWIRWWVIPRLTREMATAEEARAAVEALVPDRPDVLKMIVDRLPLDAPRVAPDVLAAAVAAGHARGVRSVAHIGRSADVVDAVHAGVDALVHGVYLEDISDQAVTALAAAKVPVAPTIAVFDAVEASLTDRTDFLPLEREIGSPDVLKALGAVPADARARYGPFVDAVGAAHMARRRNVARLRAAGVTILAGSDSAGWGNFPGAALHVELATLVEAGLTPGEALRAATSENARFLAGPEADFGEIAVGKRADLVLVDGDPTADVTHTARIVHVVLDGVVLGRHPRER